MVIETVKCWGLQIDKYFMFDAAVPSEAIDVTLVQETLKGLMLPAGTACGGWAFHEWRGEMSPDDYTYRMER